MICIILEKKIYEILNTEKVGGRISGGISRGTKNKKRYGDICQSKLCVRFRENWSNRSLIVCLGKKKKGKKRISVVKLGVFGTLYFDNEKEFFPDNWHTLSPV